MPSSLLPVLSNLFYLIWVKASILVVFVSSNVIGSFTNMDIFRELKMPYYKKNPVSSVFQQSD